MSCENAETAAEALVTALAGPKSVSSDAGSVEQHGLKDLIEAEKHLASKCSVSAGATRGLRFTKLIPNGPQW